MTKEDARLFHSLLADAKKTKLFFYPEMGKKKVYIQLGKMEGECGEEERGFLADNGTICGMENRRRHNGSGRPHTLASQIFHPKR